MNEKKLVPRRRFEEFQNADAWEQREVKEMLRGTPGSIKIGPFGSALKKECFVDNGVKVYAQENTFLRDFNVGNYYITEAKYRELQTCELFPGDLVISMMGTVGACAVFPDTAERGIMNSHLLRLQFNKNIIPEYIMFLLRDSLLIRQQINKLSVGSIMSGLSSSVVKKLVFPIPSIEEQDKLVCYFQKTDHLITLEQRKLEKTKALKSAYLAEMFPAEGERLPKRRFAGFTGEWKQQKLNEIGDYRSGKAHERNVVVSGKYIIVNSKFVSTNGNVKKFSNIQIEPLKKGELAFVLSDIPNGKALAKTFLIDKDNLYTLNQRIAGFTPKENTDSYFLKELMNRHYYFLRFDGGVGQTNLSNAAIENFESFYPCYEEQKRIGNLFKQLDEIIINQQLKLNKLKATKQAYLEEMFV